MPDITMCATEDCPLKRRCYRSEASGTRPTEYRQSWSVFQWENRPAESAAFKAGKIFDCDHYLAADLGDRL